MNPLSEYLEASEPTRRERAENWRVAIGLQKVDGLEVSPYLIETARRNVEGEISAEEARRIVRQYYEEKPPGADPEAHGEADHTSTNINAILAEPSFRLSPEYFIGLHRRIFDGVFPFAGQLRNVDITKKEWVLDGETILYTPWTEIAASLDWDFRNERDYRYPPRDRDALVEHFASFISGVWQIHPFREGNTRTIAVFSVKYLHELRFKGVTNEPFAEHAWFFRNALVRANYRNPIQGISKTTEPLISFFRNILFGEQNPLKNRLLHIRAEALGLVQTVEEDKTTSSVTVNVTENVTENRRLSILGEIKRNPKVTLPKLADTLGVNRRTIARDIAALKASNRLRRIGPDKGGHWEVSMMPSP